MDFSYSRRPFSFPMKGVNEKEYRPRKKEDDILIIQTSSVGTSASRRYNYQQLSYAEHSEWDNATGAFSKEICSNALYANEQSYSRNGAMCTPPQKELDAAEYSTPTDDETEGASNTSANSEMDALLKRFGPLQMKGIPTVQDRLEMVRDIQQRSLDYLIRILFGEDEKYVKDINTLERTSSPGEQSANNPITMLANEMGQNLGTGWSHYSFYYCAEHETTCFDTQGTAITADGRSLSFNISLEMSRSFVEMAEEKIDFGQPRLCDPLVINLNTNVASVSDQKFFFDIDADGEKDEISMLGKDSGYLALDNNADGIINDGSELFGTQSGNGFKDLLAHDEDGNGWIDEADSIFQKLKIWTTDENGTSTLLDLKEAGVGAIYLGYENTEFSLKNTSNETNAVIQKTGLFLYENGNSGTVQQMDLAV
ncbi:MAG: hypothetical protein IJA07_03270 [Agathobacter sp.]|nr:hypothetical protein [Agathobacter sp.]